MLLPQHRLYLWVHISYSSNYQKSPSPSKTVSASITERTGSQDPPPDPAGSLARHLSSRESCRTRPRVSAAALMDFWIDFEMQSLGACCQMSRGLIGESVKKVASTFWAVILPS